MNRVPGLFLVGLLALSCAISGCQQTDRAATPKPTPTTSPPLTVAAGAPTTDEQLCNAQTWPRPVPPVVGLVFAQATSGALICFDNVRAIAPDGHDVMNDKRPTGPWRIAGISPVAGSSMGKADQMTLQLVPEDLTAPPAVRPCDWVTASEAARFLRVESVSALPVGDEAGSVDQSCDYRVGNGLVTSTLQLPGSYAVDARSEFELAVAAGNGNGRDVSGLPGSAYCGRPKGASGKGPAALTVLLSRDRIYRAFGAPCDALKLFAQTAIPRVVGSR